MLGFEIRINNEKPIRAASDGIVGVLAHIGEKAQCNDISIHGMDSKLYHFTWQEKYIELGDKIRIQVSEMDNADPVSERYPNDRESLKKLYYQMKKELEEQGLI